jgi:hypothetical protein
MKLQRMFFRATTWNSDSTPSATVRMFNLLANDMIPEQIVDAYSSVIMLSINDLSIFK